MPIDHFPIKVRPFAYKTRDWMLTDSMAILILGVGVLLRGLSYAPVVFGPPPAHGTHPAEAIAPIGIWAVVWIIAGAACFFAAFVRNSILDASALGFGVGLNAMWGLSFVTASMVGDMPRGWVSSIGYFSVAALVLWAVWRGKRGDEYVGGDADAR